MDPCAHCPVAAALTCPALRPPFHPYCERVDPSSPRFHPGFPDVVRRRAAESAGAELPRPSPPNLLRRGISLAAAAAAHVVAGRPRLDDDAYAVRRAICGGDAERPACGRYRAAVNRCEACGCQGGMFEMKTRWADQKCPEGKWPDALPMPSPKETAPRE